MDVMWHTPPLPEEVAQRPSLRDDALRAHARRSLPFEEAAGGLREEGIATGRHCSACGSDEHGRPWVRLPDGRSPHVSLSRAGEHLVTVVADHPVGIDVESVAAVDARWDPALVLHPSETAASPAERAATWCRKEAILKALGTGLRTPMTEIRCADWPVEDIPAPPGLAASVVVIPQPGSGGSSTA